MFCKSKKDPISPPAKVFYDTITEKFSFLARVSRFWEMLPLTFGIPRFEILDLGDFRIGQFENYLIDKMIEWENGMEIDFDEVGQRCLGAGDFTGTELLLMSGVNLSLRIWALFLAITFPDPAEIKENKNKES